MEVILGIVVAVVIVLFGVVTEFDRDRSYYPMVLIVIAMCYGLFATIGGIDSGAWIELIAIVIFVGAAILGFRKSMWIVSIGLIAHGVFDLFHANLIDNRGVPDWWPIFCATVDVLLGIFVAIALWSGRWRSVVH